MIARRILGGALVLAAVTASAVALAAPATSKVGKLEVYADTLLAGKYDVYTDGGRMGRYDPFTEGARVGKFDTFTDGTKWGPFDPYTEGAKISDNASDNSRAGDRTLYGYRV